MRIYVMTDLEGVAGVLNDADWCRRESRYYESARELLTGEVNAAVDGLFDGGASEIVVADGHGAGGLNHLLLDPRVSYLRGWPRGWPLELDAGYHAVAVVGQHAKAGTAYAHIPHTQWFNYLDLAVNGLSIGELGQFALCAGELGIPEILTTGDEALTREAQALLPGVETVAVKRGLTPDTGEELDTDAYAKHYGAAIHQHPTVARAAIRAAAERAARRLQQGEFKPLRLAPPFERTARFRAWGDRPPSTACERHATSVIALMNMPFEHQSIG